MVSCDDAIFLGLALSPRANEHSKIHANKLLKAGEILHNQSLASGLTHVQGRARNANQKFEQTNY
jgi:hypothetical protein